AVKRGGRFRFWSSAIILEREACMKRRLLFLVPCLFWFLQTASATTFEERVAAQKAIELIYYNHRIWPKENPRPKPPFRKLMPENEIRQKVADSLQKSALLARYWKPISAQQLNGELQRILRKTRNPEMLREIFAALHNDPQLIIE